MELSKEEEKIIQQLHLLKEAGLAGKEQYEYYMSLLSRLLPGDIEKAVALRREKVVPFAFFANTAFPDDPVAFETQAEAEIPKAAENNADVRDWDELTEEEKENEEGSLEYIVKHAELPAEALEAAVMTLQAIHRGCEADALKFDIRDEFPFMMAAEVLDVLQRRRQRMTCSQ